LSLGCQPLLNAPAPGRAAPPSGGELVPTRFASTHLDESLALTCSDASLQSCLEAGVEEARESPHLPFCVALQGGGFACSLMQGRRAAGEQRWTAPSTFVARGAVHAFAKGIAACFLWSDGASRCVEHGSSEYLDNRHPDGAKAFVMLSRNGCVWGSAGLTCRRDEPLAISYQVSDEPIVDIDLDGCAIFDNGDFRCPREGFLTHAAGGATQGSATTGVGDFWGGCVRKRDATVACWGPNDVGQGGSPDRTNPLFRETAVASLARVREVAYSGEHACALLEDGTVWCWGSPDVGALGEQAKKSAPSFRVCDSGEPSHNEGCIGKRLGHEREQAVVAPTRVAELASIRSIAVSQMATCGVRSDGRILCVGHGAVGPWMVDLSRSRAHEVEKPRAAPNAPADPNPS
jgi:hypothetical protein